MALVEDSLPGVSKGKLAVQKTNTVMAASPSREVSETQLSTRANAHHTVVETQMFGTSIKYGTVRMF